MKINNIRMIVSFVCLLCASMGVFAQTVDGTVFRDYNGDGTNDADEIGVFGITVNVYDASGALVGTTTTATDGTYSAALSVGAGTPVRTEFSGWSDYLKPAPLGSDSDGTLVFAQSGDTGLDLGLYDPGEYCQPEPDLASACYIHGDQSVLPTLPRVGDTLVTYPYTSGNDGSSSIPSDYDGAHVVEALSTEIGPTFGISYHGASNSLFAGAFTKRHTSFGPSGTGAIYRIDRDTMTVSTFLDLNTLFPGSSGADTHPAGTDFDKDSATWDAVGKIALGGMDLSADQETLFVVNLGDRLLYEIPVGLTPTAPGAGSIEQHTIPTPTGCAAGDMRPFAVKFHEGKVYVGVICSAESTNDAADLDAVVSCFNPADDSWSEIARFDLDYERGCGNNADDATMLGGVRVCEAPDAGNTKYQPADWRPWKSSWDSDVDNQARSRTVVYAQPMLTDIEFVGDIIVLGLRDRLGDQTGTNTEHPDPMNTNRYTGITAGDLLMAVEDGMGGYTLEANGILDGVTGSGMGNGQGPGGGEFFASELYSAATPRHEETSMGALAYIAGSNQLLQNVFDPVVASSLLNEGFYDGGTHWYNLADGSMDQAYRLFAEDIPPFNTPVPAFGKSNALGDLEALCDPPTIEIGNRVWDDDNGNGIQDPGEAGILGVTVTLECGGGPMTTMTDANGNYLFTSVSPNLSCTLSIDPGDAALAGRSLTRTDNGGNDLHDSDGALSGGMAEISFNSGKLGANNHDYDFGFVFAGTIGDFIWQDTNGDGLQTGEAANGFDMVTVDLIDDANGNGSIDMGEAVLATQSTDAAGAYDFTGVLPGNYIVDVTDTNNVLTLFTLTTTDPLAVALSAGEDFNNADFGYMMIATGTIGDFVWSDDNGDGVQDGGESGIPGVTLDLIDDANGNGTIDGGEAVLATMTTDGTGAYDFTSLVADDYIVTVTDTGNVLTGLTLTGGVEPHAVTLGAGADYNDADFGYDDPGDATIGDFVWSDGNGDGVQDGGESGIPGVTLDLIDDANSNGTIDGGEAVLATMTTDGTGAYDFTGLDAGSYIVTVTDTGNVLTGLSLTGGVNPHAVSLAFSQDYNDADFGYDDPGDATIGDFVWSDGNGDGVQDGGESGIPGVTLDLIDDANSNGTIDGGEAVLATQTTDGAGAYDFTGLDAGDYIVTVTDTGTVLTGLSLTGGTQPHAVTLALGQDYNDADFGYDDPGTATIGDYVWSDDNGDGVQDGGEAGIPGVTLDLIDDANGNGTIDGGEAVLATMTTDGGGAYDFTGLDAGDYIVTVTDTGTVLTGLSLTGGTQPHAVSLAIGQDYNDADFGYDDPGTATIGDYVWSDDNGDGVQDGGEAGIPGVTLDLIDDANGNGTIDGGEAVLATMTTDGSGAYDFTGLDAGDYIVTVTDTGTVLTGLSLTGGTQPHAVTLAIAQDYNDADFGYDDSETASIGDQVWEDTNGNGTQDPGEPGIPNVTLDLVEDTNGNGSPDPGEPVLNTTTTDGTGLYGFPDLPAGPYLVTVTDTNGELTGLNLSGGSDPHGVTLSPGQTYDTADFGYNDPSNASIGDTVYEDFNNNGSQDPGESGIEGVTLDLVEDTNGNGSVDPGEPVSATQTTAPDGTYSFNGLNSGDYLVVVTDTGTVLTDYTLSGGTNPHPVTGLAVGTNYMDADFGYYRDRPELGAAKAATLLGNHVTYDLYLENLGNVTLTNLAMSDDLNAVFGAGLWTLAAAPSLIVDPGSFSLRGDYDGHTVTELITPGGSLAAGALAQIQFEVVVLELSDQGFGNGIYHNQVTPVAETPGGGTVEDPSDDGTDPDPNGNGDPGDPDEDDPTIVALTQIPDVTAEKSDEPATDPNGNGEVDPGEEIRYTVVLDNAGTFTAQDVVFSSGVDPNTVLVVGSVTTSQGTITSGNSAGNSDVGVDVGDIPVGNPVTITFRVTVNNPLPLDVVQVSCQGDVEGGNIPPEPTDDPDTMFPEDPTVTPIGGNPLVEVYKADGLLDDLDMDGNADPGESLRYTVVITNTGNRTATTVVFDTGVDPKTALLTGTVTTTVGTVTLGNSPGDTTVSVNLGDLEPDALETITFDVVLDDPWTSGNTEIVCQGSASGGNFEDEPSDDPDTPGEDDPTITPVEVIPTVTIIKMSELWIDGNGDGFLNPGDTLRYTLDVTNDGPVTAIEAILTDTPDPNTQLVVGSVTTDRGSVTVGNTTGDTTLEVDLGDMEVGGMARITFEALLAPLGPGVTQILNQAHVVGLNFDQVASDDPNSNPDGDPTVNVIAYQVPTLGEWALSIFMALMAAAGLLIIRRNKP